MTKKYFISTFGCQMNKNDSEHLAGMLECQGYKPAETAVEANLVVFNTCAVRQKAEIRVYGHLAKLNYLRKKNNLDLKIYLSGCMPAYNKEYLLKRFKYLDGIIDIQEARDYPAKRADTPQAWISIMQGCDNFCSYCIVPYTRGRETSRAAEEILAELAQLDYSKNEIIYLLGQNVNSYQGTYQGKTINFPKLVELILKEFPKIPKLGFMTSHPKDMSERLIELITSEPRIDREVHLPLQHANDRILKLMNRGYTYAHYKNLVEKLRAKRPEVRVATDLIVGFPSETEDEFEDLCKTVKELNFYRVIASGYSPRSGTKAAELPDPIPQKVIDERLRKLNKLVIDLKPLR